MLSEAEYQNFLDWWTWQGQNVGFGGMNPPPNDSNIYYTTAYQQYQTLTGATPTQGGTSTSISPAQQQELNDYNQAMGTNYTWGQYKILVPSTTRPLPEGYPDTYTDANGNVYRWDSTEGGYIRAGYNPPTKEKEGYSSYEEALNSVPQGSGYYPVQGTNGRWFLQAPSPTSDVEKQRLDLERQQLAWQQQYQQQGLEAEKQARLANLRANPQSWLEYASLANQQPAIQPWMLPLMPQEYAGTVAGAPIPGWQSGAPTMAELPSLTNPSIQYQARMGPTALQQYYGYQQARTGANPQESQWRLWSQAPPGGSKGLVWQR